MSTIVCNTVETIENVTVCNTGNTQLQNYVSLEMGGILVTYALLINIVAMGLRSMKKSF